jgi:hypothetical protein
MPRHGSILLAFLACLVCFVSAPCDGVEAANGRSVHATQHMLRDYFADLNAHRFHAAWRLEAPCRTSYTVSNGSGSPSGSGGFMGKGRWVAPRGTLVHHPVVAAARVTAIRRLYIPILARNHIDAFAVSGWFRFDYTAIPYANDTHRSGFHVVKIAMWRCSGQWGVQPGWEDSGGGPLSWS